MKRRENVGDQNRAKLRRSVVARSAVFILFIAFLAIFSNSSRAQQPKASQPETTTLEALPSFYLFAGVDGFIPMRQGYRLNYSTSLAGMPIEVMGGMIFPVTPAISTPLALRYINRKANFISQTSISVFSIEPGVRVFLEKQREKDIRIFAGADVLIAQASVHSIFDASTDGTVTGSESAEKTYPNLGLGFDLGFAYPLTQTSALEALVHAAIYLGSPLSHGGIGNIGGVSIGGLYRFGL